MALSGPHSGSFSGTTGTYTYYLYRAYMLSLAIYTGTKPTY